MTIEVDGSQPRVPRQRSATRDDGPAMRAVELELHGEFPSVPIDQVRVLVECLWLHFEDAPVREFVPLLVRKQAREEMLDHLGPRTDTRVSSWGPHPV